MSAVGYCRVSTDEQDISLDSQGERIRAYCKLYSIDLLDVFKDVASGKSLKRDGLNASLNLLNAGAVDTLVVAKFDRLTRSVRDLGALIDEYFSDKKSCRLVSVSEQIDTFSAAGRLVLHLMTSVAQWEREIIGERTSMIMQLKKNRGEYTGGKPPFGYRLRDGKLVRNPNEQLIIDRAKQLGERGKSLREIGCLLYRDGYKTRKKGQWRPEQIRRLLAM